MDRENVIKGLECCIGCGIEDTPGCEDCPYNDMDDTCVCMRPLYEDALALLKAQEPIAPEPTTDNDWVCGNCAESLVGYSELDAGGFVTYRFSYCPNCGRAVKWNG